MKTVLTKSATTAAEFIKQNGLVAFPTETVYGLGADVFNETAVAKIFAAKGRPSDNPLIAHVADETQIKLLVSRIADSAEKFIAALFPGPLTLVLPKSANVPLTATAGLETIGVRMPRHALAAEFLRACAIPLVAPSANLSGKPSPTTWAAVYEDLNTRIDCILQGEQTNFGLESTVVDCTGETPLILRAGAVTLEQLRSVVPKTEFAATDAGEIKRSPGTRYKHYAPAANVVLVDSPNEIIKSENAAFIGLDAPTQEFQRQMICRDAEEYAHALFAFFRECDARGIKTIYCQKVVNTGVGLAVNDRLKRAAAN